MAREGRIVLMRADVWKQANGTVRKRLSPQDIVATACAGFPERDVGKMREELNPKSDGMEKKQ